VTPTPATTFTHYSTVLRNHCRRRVFIIRMTPNVCKGASSRRTLSLVIAMVLGAGVLALSVIYIMQSGKRSELRRFEAGLTNGAESLRPRDSLIESFNALGFDVFAQLVKSHPGQNVLFSPASLAEALAMLSEGAAGSTRDEIAKTLRLSGSNLNGLALSNAAILKTLIPLDPALNLAFANGLWVNQNEGIASNYISRMEHFFGAQVRSVNFTSSDAPEILNQWISNKTCGRIQRIYPRPFDPNLEMILINTLHFKGEWMSPFDPATTHDAPFKLLNGETIRCPQMRRFVTAYHCNNPLFEAVQLMFNDGDLGLFKVNMVVMLPKDISHFDKFLDSLNTVNWTQWQQAFTLLGGSVTLPRFRISAQSDLVENLQACGIRNAFNSEKADFRPIGSSGLYVTECRQAVTIDVNEHGAEAAAATDITLGRGGPPPESFTMIINRPFVILICSDDTILFMAAVTDPR